MNASELDQFLRKKTRREHYYLDNPSASSPTYRDLEHRTIRGKDVLYFKLPALKEAEILIRKDSRFTDVPYYIHSNLNINYVYSGNCHVVIDENAITLNKGDVAIFDKDVVRRKLYAHEGDIIINISMSNEFFSSSFLRSLGKQSLISQFMLHALSEHSHSHDHYLVFRSGEVPSIPTLFEPLLIEYYSNRIYRKEIMQGYLHVIFVELLRLYHENPDKQLIKISPGGSHSILDILHHIEDHYADIRLDELSKQFGYHPKYLTSMLKKQTGYSFKEIQTEQRLKEAARLLAETEDPIHTIFQKVGISNENYFYQQFKETYRMTPGEYRKHNH